MRLKNSILQIQLIQYSDTLILWLFRNKALYKTRSTVTGTLPKKKQKQLHYHVTNHMEPPCLLYLAWRKSVSMVIDNWRRSSEDRSQTKRNHKKLSNLTKQYCRHAPSQGVVDFLTQVQGKGLIGRKKVHFMNLMKANSL